MHVMHLSYFGNGILALSGPTGEIIQRYPKLCTPGYAKGRGEGSGWTVAIKRYGNGDGNGGKRRALTLAVVLQP